ncbi:hypothetical protein N7491_001220 [Penicillium cf. griseofulvum]|uniref:GPI anchored cell wall protein n=1 Tax=Penicillium cf. griseofulvum TaxID=2972120 RepID=A0A9W9JB84_9EURO|nr:hypothetical protein N7472_006355 [Penicillium cf. griseofulvum]KAJ5445138.1 hypothetical protein N7491_001220 [Penicillium cf. griseofulvum]KAJ5446859.1 hypothetical protein N7445_001680 [Penicillium cf. griseofulvum]
MLFSKSIFAVAVVALANVVSAGTVQTPACVLKIIGHQANPADSKAICGANASKIQDDISENCPDSEASLKFFANNCAQLGHKVVTVSTTSTGTESSSATATGFVTATQTGSSAATSTGSSSAAGSTGAGASASGSAASPSSTFNAASSDRKYSATTFVAAIFIGAAALL